jgi:KipI family sensor histidine kinase inhibitor
VTAGIVAFGDRALRFPVEATVDRRALLAVLRATDGVVDVVLAEDAGAVVLRGGARREDVEASIAQALTSPSAGGAAAPLPAHHVVRVVYDGEDLPAVAAQTGLSEAEVIELHAGGDYEVAMVGFMPGFAYLRGLDPRLVLARRAEPRTRVPAGSVAIAAEYTGIYPFASPGGWHLLGRAVGHTAFDANGAALALGDRVRFAPDLGSSNEPRFKNEPRFENEPRYGVEVRRAVGLAVVVDGGRVGHMHEGVPHGGAMVPEALARANRAVGNDAGAAAIEIYGLLEVAARGGAVAVASDDGEAKTLQDGEAISVATDGRVRVRYLAVRGGIDVPVVLGGRGTLLAAALGGFGGRALRRGDHVAVGSSTITTATATAAAATAATESDDAIDVPVLAGPDHDEHVMEAIARATFTIGMKSDRIGTRLEGPALPAHSMQTARERKSRPMVLGAIEITPAGLVVLGPDHPTTGGYPVVAVVRSDALGLLLARRIGARVRLFDSAKKTT